MKLYELLLNTEIQSEYKVVYYDDQKEERIEVKNENEVQDNEIKYIYAENEIIYIEIEKE